MRISIVGTGYLGLVSGVCLASKGHQVTCVDVLKEKVDLINRGDPPIYEKGLTQLLKSVLGTQFHASTDLAACVLKSELTLIAVGTPFDGEQIDLQYVSQVAKQIGELLRTKEGYHTVAVTSTVIPGTTENIVIPLLEEYSGKKAGEDFGVGMIPEFLKEGEAIADFMNPDRIVLGGIDEKSISTLEAIYAKFPQAEIIRTNPRTAEMVKYAANSLLTTLISFSNEMGNLCAEIGDVDIVDVMHGVHLDKRISPMLESGERLYPSLVSYLSAGCGFGGSCLPKDVSALIKFAKDKGQNLSILKSVLETNAAQPHQMVNLLRKEFQELEGLRVSILGMAFKPGTDDVRDSASMVVIKELKNKACEVTAFDPHAQEKAKAFLGEDAITYAATLEDSILNADAILLMTSWPEFKEIPKILQKTGKAPLFIDGRRFLDKSLVANYRGIGLS